VRDDAEHRKRYIAQSVNSLTFSTLAAAPCDRKPEVNWTL